MVAVVVVALLLVGVAGYYLADTTPTSIQVTEMDVYAPDNVCGLNSHRIAYYGFNDTANDHLPIQLPVENFNTTACTIRDVSTDTSGFAVQNVETNDTIAGGQSGTLSLTLALPGGAFTGPVDLIFR